ncbi:U3 small nucleolar RNA-associated protein 10 [Mycena sanguinolenta]|uniref:U3 small nucleolar RNA-associated protein 10 n=1 Tax=Mycena sanguinolenta TaxID=230812 RepID=A0A8H7DIJ5_9AGAR|nr:U3 small nucleolar RNA-associated protein 10 [Mycena sanguinolenta]
MLNLCLLLFLPYHESPHFAKMLSILHIKLNSTWSFLLPFKSAAQNVPRPSLVTEMLKNSDATRFIVNLLPTAIKANCVHHTLLAFNAATLHDYLTRTKTLDEGILALLLPALLEPLQHRSDVVKDAILGSYILLSALAQVCQLTPLALKTIINAMASSARRVATNQFVSAVVSVCEAQEQLDALTDGTGRSVLKLSDIKEALRGAEKWSGIEKFVSPLLTTVLRRMDDDNDIAPFFESIISSPTASTEVLQHLTNLLLTKTVSADGEMPPRRLLALIQQRHPLLVQEAADEITRSDADMQERVDNVVTSLSLSVIAPQASANGHSEVGSVVASMSADERARTAAVKELFKALPSAQGDAVELQSIHSALLARVQDTSAIVLNTLYADSASILPVFLANPKSYVDLLSSAVTANSKPKRPLLRLHLGFLMTHFCAAASAESVEDVFHKILFPFLLFSKSRQHSADLVWELISQHPSARYDLLAGCADAWVVEKGNVQEGGDGDTTERDENIMASDRFARHFSDLIRKAHETDPHVRVLAYLVIRKLLSQLSGIRLLDASTQVLEAVNLQRLPEVDIPAKHTSLSECLDSAYLGRTVVHKITSKNTTHWLQVDILALVATIPRPAETVCDWFEPESLATLEGSLYVKLTRAVYSLANSASTTTHSLFLAGVWTTSLDSAPDLCVVALRHAAAFLEAHNTEADGVDFQTILPALIICLQSADTEIRSAALDCIAVQHNLAEQRFSAVYAFDAIYGESEAKLQYLAQGDLKKYLDALMEHQEHIALDASYVRVFHVQLLGRDNKDKKKDSEYKHNVLCWILSHVHVLRLLSARIALLRCIEDISDKSKTEMLLPVLQALSQDDRPLQPDSPAEQFATLVVASFDLSASPALNDVKSPLWNVFVAIVQHYLKPGPISACRTVLLQRLEHGLIASLTIDRKVEVCNLLLDAGTKDADVYLSCKKPLAAVLNDIPLIVRLLIFTRPEVKTSPRASKRPKLSEVTDDSFPRLSLLAEVLASVPLPGSLDLVSRLLETLHNVVQSTTSTDVDISYIEQSLMSAVEHSAEKITEVPNLAPSAIRLDILVDLIRVADNPQTFNQALLLMATLARLAPDSVLHNVMPIFTFMGSNVFHRDDSYSFKVVQKTVNSIVPVMVSSLKSAHSARLDLYLASRDFLRVFTDAASHIPRHRRTSFFGHLVDVLGPADFLPPLCMLLVEKMTNRVILTEILREAQRLTARAADPENLEPSLLDTLPDDDQPQALAAAFKRRAQALVVFVGFAIKMSPSTTTGAGHWPPPEAALRQTLRIDDISQAARTSLSNALGCMSAVDFIDAVLSILQSGDSQVQRGAFGSLLSERLHHVADATRLKITARVIASVDEIRKLLLLHPDGPLAASSYRALRSIAATMSPGEEGSLTTMVPPILVAIRGRKMVGPAMTALAPLSVKLGPRLIPFFRDIVVQCVALLQEGVEGKFFKVVTETLNVIHGLLTSIPTFWGPAELTQVSKLYIEHHASSDAPLTTLMKTVAKRAPTGVLISALVDMWPSLQTSPQTENIRQLFAIFLQAFDVGAIATPKSEAEAQAISAFIELVVKLNEASFRPLFRKLYDWAFAGEIAATADLKRKITFCNVYAGAFGLFQGTPRDLAWFDAHSLGSLQGLMNPYLSFLVQPFVAALKDYNADTLSDPVLWAGILDIFSKSLASDDGAFWRDDKLRLVAPALVQQVPVCIRLGGSAEAKALVTECLVALTESAADDVLLKTLNLDVLMHTRSDDARLRVFALACATALWNAHGGKLLAFASETATFIAECSEDEHDMVVKMSLQLKNAMESVAGNITGL